MAANIAEKSIILGEEPPMKPYIDIPRMAEIARGMIGESLDALVNEDTIWRARSGWRMKP